MEEEQTFFDFREVLWKARRYKWIALFPIVLGLCCAWIYLMLTPGMYESVVVVAVADNSPVSPALGGIVRREQTEESRREEAQRVDGRIHSRPFLEAIVRRMGYAKTPELLLDAAAAARQWRGVPAQEFSATRAGFPTRK